MFFWQAEKERANEESSIDNSKNLNDEINENNSTIVVSSDNENENMSDNVNENENVEENVNDKVNDVYREICFRFPSVYATEDFYGRTALRCLVCDEIQDNINDLRDAFRHQRDYPYHRDQVEKMVKNLSYCLCALVFLH